MSAEPDQPDELHQKVPLQPANSDKGNPLLRLPGLLFISLYMLGLSAMVTSRVATHHAHPLYLVLAVLFLIAGFGLALLFRWAWSLTLAAVFLPMSYCLWLMLRHAMPYEVGFVQILLNMLLFRYLVRPEVRAVLR